MVRFQPIKKSSFLKRNGWEDVRQKKRRFRHGTTCEERFALALFDATDSGISEGAKMPVNSLADNLLISFRLKNGKRGAQKQLILHNSKARLRNGNSNGDCIIFYYDEVVCDSPTSPYLVGFHRSAILLIDGHGHIAQKRREPALLVVRRR